MCKTFDQHCNLDFCNIPLLNIDCMRNLPLIFKIPLLNVNSTAHFDVACVYLCGGGNYGKILPFQWKRSKKICLQWEELTPYYVKLQVSADTAVNSQCL